MLKRFFHLFIVLLIESAALMAVGIMGAKLLAPLFGSSLYVWTAVLTITILGLTLGYYTGGKYSTKPSAEKHLMWILLLASLLVFALTYTASVAMTMSSGIGLIPGVWLSAFLLLVPPMFCFGLVGPLVVRLMSTHKDSIGHVAGNVYLTSTLGGIIATFIFGFFIIPEQGLKFSALMTAGALCLVPILYFIKQAAISYQQSALSSQPSALSRSTNHKRISDQRFQLATHNSQDSLTTHNSQHHRSPIKNSHLTIKHLT